MRSTLFLLLLAIATPAAAQSRIDQIASDFSKLKHQTKTKKGASTTKFKEVVAEPWQAGSMHAYAGHYRSLGDPMHLDLHVGADGAVSAHGTDPEPFELHGARIEAAVLSGTKTYRDGRREPFEGGFLKRSDRSAPGERFTTRYGIGMLVDAPEGTGIIGLTRIFLEKR